MSSEAAVPDLYFSSSGETVTAVAMDYGLLQLRSMRRVSDAGRLRDRSAFAPTLSRLGDEPDKTGDPGQHRTVRHSAAIADSAIATSTKVSEKVGARPRSAKADGLRAFTVAPVRLRPCQ